MKRNPLLAEWVPVANPPKDKAATWHKMAFLGTMLEQPMMWKDDAWCWMDFKLNDIVPHNPQPTHWLKRPIILIPEPPKTSLIT